jgi:hypothetical protein
MQMYSVNSQCVPKEIHEDRRQIPGYGKEEEKVNKICKSFIIHSVD